MLWRQLHPSWIVDGRVTSQVFRPMPKDQGRVSVYDGEQIDALASLKHYREQLGYSSIGTLGVSVRECEELKLVVRLDPTPFPEHAIIDLNGFSTGQIKQKAVRLRDYAVARGWQAEGG